MSHTPGPWKVYDRGHNTLHVGTVADGWAYETVCCLYENKADNYDTSPDYQLFENAEANAELIALLPDLLDLAEQMLAEASVEMPSDLIAAADAVIRKARGEA
jgi:hypothetical protein